MTIDEIFDKIYILPGQSKSALKAKTREVTFPKGHILLRSEKIERKIYFLKKGIVRAYADSANGQVTFWFGTESDTILSMKSYVSGEKSYENIELLEECSLYELEIRHLKELYEKDIYLANWGRKLIESELVKTEERLISMQFKTAQQRYTDLITNRPELLQRVQLGHIASYLGMSQVSLSRIRAERR